MQDNIELLQQIKLHKELSKKIEELEEQKKLLGLSIMAQMADKTLKIPGYIVRRCSRLSISVPLEKARLLQATKMQEIVDKERIKSLYNSGQPIEGVKEITYIQVSEHVLDPNVSK
jgi:hypothetical protein